MRNHLEHGIHKGDILSFVEWWNNEKNRYYGGKYRIVYLKEDLTNISHVLVEYIVQKG